MAFTNSGLVVHTNLSPNRTAPRNKPITKITIHHTAGVIGIENLGSCFANATRKASSNYGIGSDGRIGMYVEEKDRAWTSSSAANDNQAVTIEVSNSATGGEWPVSEKAFNALIDLCTDICRRNGIPRLYYDGTPSGSLTHHQMFSATSCPGQFLLNRFQQICAEVNNRLGTAAPPAPATPDTSGLTLIAGAARATVEQMRAYIQKLNPAAPDLAAMFLEEGAAEGIRGDVAFAQSCLETGNFKYGGDVKPEQNNFAGIGATGGGVAGNTFPTPQIGVRAQIQHLKAYANTEPLSGDLVDPRFAYVARGVAQYVEWLGIQENPSGKGWASGKDYGTKILKILAAIIATDAPAAPPMPSTPTPEAPAPALDNTPREWEKKAVDMAISRGIIQGDTTGNLRLHEAATRADVLVLLERCGVL